MLVWFCDASCVLHQVESHRKQNRDLPFRYVYTHFCNCAGGRGAGSLLADPGNRATRLPGNANLEERFHLVSPGQLQDPDFFTSLNPLL